MVNPTASYSSLRRAGTAEVGPLPSVNAIRRSLQKELPRQRNSTDVALPFAQACPAVHGLTPGMCSPLPQGSCQLHVDQSPALVLSVLGHRRHAQAQLKGGCCMAGCSRA